MKHSGIYTRTGDDGTTSIIGGKRIMKTDVRIEAYGTLDELNSSVGYLSSLIDDSEIKLQLEKIQCDLFAAGTALAKEDIADAELRVDDLEDFIDRYDAEVPPMHCFILPGGSPRAAYAHVCRTVCRRAERCILHFSETHPLPMVIVQYVNRLSDYFFILSRKLNFIDDMNEKRL